MSKHNFKLCPPPVIGRCLLFMCEECGFYTASPGLHLDAICKEDDDEQETERQTQRKAADVVEQLQQESASD